MLVLHPTSRCDVCLLEYTWENSARAPHAIACGHIFCRDCLYATTPPQCPLCRRVYQPGKIKKLHVDRPENVDEAREVELARQQIELLEQLVCVWDLELREGLVSDFNEDRDQEQQDIDTHPESQFRVSEGPRPPTPGVVRTDEQIGGLLGLRDDQNFHQIEEHTNNDVGHILDGIAGEPGVGRSFLERWGPTLVSQEHEESPGVSLRQAQKVHAEEVLRRVDVWLEGKDQDSAVALQKSRLFFSKHLELRVALKDALETAKSLHEERSNLMRDLHEFEKSKETMLAAEADLHRSMQAIVIENQNLKARLTKRPRNSSPLRNPLPPPPEPIPLDQIPTISQVVSEGSDPAYTYSPARSNPGVRFAMSPDFDGQRQQYTPGVEDGSAQPFSPNGTPSRRRRRGKDSSHYSYRDDSGYFEDENRFQQSSSSPTYPSSAPPALQGFTSSQRSNEYGSYTGYDQSRQTIGHDSGYASRPGSYEGKSQPLDVYAATSHYLREYSAGYVNGQAAALGVGPFAPPQQIITPAPTRSGTDNTGSIVFTSESMEESARQDRGQSQLVSPRSGHRSTSSQVSNSHLGSLFSPPPGGHISVVSLPSVSSHGQPSHGHPSPSLSSLQHPSYTSSHSSSNLQAREGGSPRQSVASSIRNPPPSLPHDDPVAAQRILENRHGNGRISPGSSTWDTNSDARSNSLIYGLRGPRFDSASIRSRATRLSVDFESVRDSRRESHVSFDSREIPEIQEEPRNVNSMVGVLPHDEPNQHAQRSLEAEFPLVASSLRHLESSADASLQSYRSSTGSDRNGWSGMAAWNGESNDDFSGQGHRDRTGVHRSRRVESQESGTTGHYGTSDSSHRFGSRVTSRSRERRSNRDNDSDRRRRPAMTHRSQTSMGITTHNGSSSSGWRYENDSHHQPLPHSSHTHEQPSRSARERDRDANQERSSRSRAHRDRDLRHTSSRPSLLTRDPSTTFPVSVETTDDERYPLANPTLNTNNEGQSTRFGRHANNSTATISGNGTTESHSSLGIQNALGLELTTAANGANTLSRHRR